MRISKRIYFISVLMLVAFSPSQSSAERIQFPESQGSIEIPEKWIEIPPEEILANGGQVTTPGQTPGTIKMYQLADAESWFEWPTIQLKFENYWTPMAAMRMMYGTKTQPDYEEALSSRPKITQ